MDWKFLFSTFEARIGRQSFWIGHIVLIAVGAAAHLVIAALFGTGHAAMALLGVISLILVYPSLAVDVKRLHDRGKSGWWILLLLIPFIGAVWFVVELGCLSGTPGTNRFGPDPLAAGPVAA